MAKITMKGGGFFNNGVGLQHGSDAEIEMTDVSFVGNGVAIQRLDKFDRDQVLPFLEKLESIRGYLSKSEIEDVSRQTGLTDYLREHGWEVGSFVLGVQQAIQQNPAWLSSALAWARGWI